MIVRTIQDFNRAMDIIAGSDFLAYDTETTGLNPRKDKIMGFGVSTVTGGFYVPVREYVPGLGQVVSALDIILVKSILTALKSKQLLMFNASFDARFTKYDLGIDLLPALHTDVLLLKHTCDEDFPLDLKGIGKKLYGIEATEEKETLKKELREAGAGATQYFKATTETLAKYCIQDCVLTFKIYNHYRKELRRQNLESFYYNDEVLPLYCEVTIPMEEAGVRMDRAAMEAALHSITKDINTIERGIQEAILPHLELFTTWFLNKEYPVQTATGKQPAWAKKGYSQQAAWEIANPGAYMFNLNSKHHLKKLFFDTLQCEPLSRTPTGLPQVDEEFLESVANELTWVQQLIEYNKLNKIKSTYIERFLHELEDGDRFYPAFQQHRTVSGRYSGDLQQLPRPLETGQASPLVVHYTNLIRAFVLPDSNSKLLSADYEQLEPSIFAHTSGDPALQRIFNEGLDFYSEVAIRTENLADVSSDKKANNYLGKVNKTKRQQAKAYALGIAYGMTGYKLQFEIGVSQEVADALVQSYLRGFPGLANWMAASQDEVCHSGQIRSQAGRIRRMPRAKILFNRYGIRLRDALQTWKDYHEWTDLYAEAKAARKEFINYLNNAINFQVQSLAASIVNRAAIRIARQLRKAGLQSRLVAQVHDELVLNVLESEIEIVGELVQTTMQTIVPLKVPLRTVPQFGNNYKECK